MLCALCSLEWKKAATVMQTNIICRRYSTFVFSTQWHLLYIYKLRIINNIFWVLTLRALICIIQMMDPAGIANWSVTYVDWSEGKWHPRSFRAKDVTYERLKNMTVCLSILHIILTWLSWSLLISLTSIFSAVDWCEHPHHQWWEGAFLPCYLNQFACKLLRIISCLHLFTGLLYHFTF